MSISPPDIKNAGSRTMPLLFIGHGSPMNAIEENPYSLGWRTIASSIPRPRAILCISAHWESRGTFVTAMESPGTIHDFYGFPEKLFAVQYPAHGDQSLAGRIATMGEKIPILPDNEWGLDHGCWSVLNQMYPQADIPVVQLSLDSSKPPPFHLELGHVLSELRNMGILILGSGNIVHNLRLVAFEGNGIGDFNRPFGFEWALEANEILKKLILSRDYKSLSGYKALGRSVQLAIPTPEHFLPLLYILGAASGHDSFELFNDAAVGGSLAMTSLLVSP